ncbi:uncharacterized protein MONBRDRAFT_26139 [Monosiga brevicollis MX1]|uniref:Uncharacterized protein n=1 Tax=Monosiga brevicollis TaxID=81824 RepID=A9V1G9_MONBE|nr:uncharacterized protein MONBRDRAFT_26139 [Monosiga brevicollis MX1]EDQ88437.1 predicted protein [Monosiga brevicollis MX1]|eukprot:XP_001746541.1 hypothetical protein [Monosiga brevicollis MX1]
MDDDPGPDPEIARHNSAHFLNRLKPLTALGPPSGAPAGALAPTTEASTTGTIARDLADRLPVRLWQGLLPFQREAVVFGVARNGRILIGDQMGCGKTISAIALACAFRQEWPVLIVAPTSVRGSWVDELEEWLRFLTPNDICVVRSGKDVARLDAAVVVVTYGLLNQSTMMDALAAQRFKVVIIDESHYLKNSRAKRTQSLLPILRRARRVIMLSGTPALARPEKQEERARESRLASAHFPQMRAQELYTQVDALKPGYLGSWTSYAQRYCDRKRNYFGGWDTKGASNLPELHDKLRAIMIRRLKKDVLSQLPPKRRQRVLLDVGEADLKRVQQIKQQLDKLDPVDAESKMQSHALLQSLYKETGAAKIPAVREYIRGLCQTGDKFLVFAYHLDVLDAVHVEVVAAKLDYIMIRGDTPVSERQAGVRKFQGNDSCRVAILSMTAAGQGLTLTAASTVIFAELHWTPGIIEQAEDRVHRIGQGDPVNVQYLVARRTLDDTMWNIVDRKVGVVSSALDGQRERLRAKNSTAQREMGDLRQRNSLVDSEDVREGAAQVTDMLREHRSELIDATITSKSDLRNFWKSPNARSRPHPKVIVEPWSCPACTFLNGADGQSPGSTNKIPKQCQMCGTPRPKRQSSTGSQSEVDERQAPIMSTATETTQNDSDDLVNMDGQLHLSPGSGFNMDGPSGLHSFDPRSSFSRTLFHARTDDTEIEADAVAPKFKFCVSRHTGRLHLFDLEDRPLMINFHMDDFQHDRLKTVPTHLQAPAARREVLRFIATFNRLKAAEQHALGNLIMANVQDGQRLLRKAKEERKSGSARKASGYGLCAYRPTALVAPSTRRYMERTSSVPSGESAAASTNTTPQLKQVTEQRGRRVGEAMALAFRHCFVIGCQNACNVFVIAGWQTGTGGSIRRRLAELEQGVCQLCHLDCQTLLYNLKGASTTSERLRLLAQTTLHKLPLERRERIARAPKAADLWQADHIVPVCEGGGEAEIEEFRTLCTVCHQGETQRLVLGGRAARQLRHAAKGSGNLLHMWQTTSTSSSHSDRAPTVIELDD